MVISLASSPLLGAIFETFVISEIVKQMQGMKVKPNLYHWRAHSGAEIDLVPDKVLLKI